MVDDDPPAPQWPPLAKTVTVTAGRTGGHPATEDGVGNGVDAENASTDAVGTAVGTSLEHRADFTRTDGPAEVNAGGSTGSTVFSPITEALCITFVGTGVGGVGISRIVGALAEVDVVMVENTEQAPTAATVVGRLRSMLEIVMAFVTVQDAPSTFSMPIAIQTTKNIRLLISTVKW